MNDAQFHELIEHVDSLGHWFFLGAAAISAAIVWAAVWVGIELHTIRQFLHLRK